MKTHTSTSKVLIHSNLRHFFLDSVSQALKNQHTEADAATVVYIVNLLTCFTRSENFFEQSSDKPALKPLALHYHDALSAQSELEKHMELQRLGDVALFVSGIFSQSLANKPVGLDYYINMGGSAYAYLADISDRQFNDSAFSDIFTELSDKFVMFVDALNEVSEGIQTSSDTDLLRLHEIWLQTGSQRAKKILQQKGLLISDHPLNPIRH